MKQTRLIPRTERVYPLSLRVSVRLQRAFDVEIHLVALREAQAVERHEAALWLAAGIELELLIAPDGFIARIRDTTTIGRTGCFGWIRS
jgi:hypothetical protein